MTSGLPVFDFTNVLFKGMRLDARLSSEIDKALKDTGLSDRLTAQGPEVVGATSQQFAKFVRRNAERRRSAVEVSGAKID